MLEVASSEHAHAVLSMCALFYVCVQPVKAVAKDCTKVSHWMPSLDSQNGADCACDVTCKKLERAREPGFQHFSVLNKQTVYLFKLCWSPLVKISRNSLQ